MADANARIETTRLLSWRALDAALSGDPRGLEWALHAKVFGSSRVSAYDNDIPLERYLDEALASPVIEGSNLDVRRRQMQALLTAGGYTPLAACSAGHEARVHGFTTGTSEIDPSSPSSRSLVAGPMKR